jgi:sterol desaturase/sphingolipid hydroxylase (fatty acid hydroxylase superfamily)
MEREMMEFLDGIKAIGMILVVMAFIAMVEAVIPLHRRNSWSKSHIVPNLAVTLVTFGTNLFLNAPILIGLLWLEANGYGLFNLFAMNPVVEIIASVLVLDLAWYATHVTMHKVPSLWPYHVVHHSDPFVDMTTTARQHPGESLLRYVFLAGFGFTCGVSPAGFAAYKIWQVLSGMLGSRNGLKLP